MVVGRRRVDWCGVSRQRGERPPKRGGVVDYFGAIQKAAQEHGLNHPLEMFTVFLDQLRQNHEQNHGFGAGKVFNDGLDSLTQQHAVSWAESLHNFCRVTANVNDHNAANWRKHGKDAEAQQLEEYNKRLKAFVAVLAHFLPIWNFGGREIEDKVKDISQRVAKNPPAKRDDPPPAGYKEADDPPEPPKPRDRF